MYITSVYLNTWAYFFMFEKIENILKKFYEGGKYIPYLLMKYFLYLLIV